MAKNLVAAGLADRVEVQVAYAIGVAHPVSVMVETFGTEKIGRGRIAALVDEFFDLRPGAFREYLKLHRPIYQKTAAYGHFGREDDDFTWEKTDKADALREAAGLAAADPGRLAPDVRRSRRLGVVSPPSARDPVGVMRPLAARTRGARAASRAGRDSPSAAGGPGATARAPAGRGRRGSSAQHRTAEAAADHPGAGGSGGLQALDGRLDLGHGRLVVVAQRGVRGVEQLGRPSRRSCASSARASRRRARSR